MTKLGLSNLRNKNDILIRYDIYRYCNLLTNQILKTLVNKSKYKIENKIIDNLFYIQLHKNIFKILYPISIKLYLNNKNRNNHTYIEINDFKLFYLLKFSTLKKRFKIKFSIKLIYSILKIYFFKIIKFIQNTLKIFKVLLCKDKNKFDISVYDNRNSKKKLTKEFLWLKEIEHKSFFYKDASFFRRYINDKSSIKVSLIRYFDINLFNSYYKNDFNNVFIQNEFIYFLSKMCMWSDFFKSHSIKFDFDNSPSNSDNLPKAAAAKFNNIKILSIERSFPNFISMNNFKYQIYDYYFTWGEYSHNIISKNNNVNQIIKIGYPYPIPSNIFINDDNSSFNIFLIDNSFSKNLDDNQLIFEDDYKEFILKLSNITISKLDKRVKFYVKPKRYTKFIRLFNELKLSEEQKNNFYIINHDDIEFSDITFPINLVLSINIFFPSFFIECMREIKCGLIYDYSGFLKLDKNLYEKYNNYLFHLNADDLIYNLTNIINNNNYYQYNKKNWEEVYKYYCYDINGFKPLIKKITNLLNDYE